MGKGVLDEQGKFGIHALPDGLLWKEIPEYTNQATYAWLAARSSDSARALPFTASGVP